MTSHNDKDQGPGESALLEALRQNWESARYHESARWKYTYAYYAAFGVILLYLLKQENLSNLLENPRMITFLAVLFFLLTLGGTASFLHLLHANMEYKNHIRAIEFIARDLKLNIGITEYRKEKKEIKRTTYMALPLLLKIRRGVTFKNLTNIGISISAAMSLFYILIFLPSLCGKKLKQFLMQYYIDYLILILPLLIAIAIFYGLDKFWEKIEYRAKEELNTRDPSNLECITENN